MSIFQALILGLVQGLTEFLPVSSSGHLKLVERWLGLDLSQGQLLFFDTLLHCGTLIAVLTALWPLVREIAGNFFGSRRNPRQLPDTFKRGGGNRMLLAVVIGTIPALVMALLLDDRMKSALNGRWLGIGFFITAVALCLGEVLPKRKPAEDLSPLRALLVGLGQAIALLPGASRSGMTITAGRAAGIKGETAVRYSLLLSVVAIVGAIVLQLPDAIGEGLGVGILPLIVGVAAAAGSGFFAVRWLLKLVQSGRMLWVAGYMTVMGILIYWGII